MQLYSRISVNLPVKLARILANTPRRTPPRGIGGAMGGPSPPAPKEGVPWGPWPRAGHRVQALWGLAQGPWPPQRGGKYTLEGLAGSMFPPYSLGRSSPDGPTRCSGTVRGSRRNSLGRTRFFYSQSVSHGLPFTQPLFFFRMMSSGGIR